jgi:hypothetical protein
MLFGDDPKYLKLLAEPFQHLQTLHLTFDATECAIIRFWKGLGEFLTSIPQLKDLRMGFIVPDTGFNEPISWYPSKTVHLWYLPLWKLLGEHVWRELKSLRSDGLVLCELGLKRLVERHPTLEFLELHNIGLWAGTFRGLFSGFREMAFLKEFIVSGHLRAFHTPYEAWYFHRGVDPHHETWCEAFLRLSATNPDNDYEEDIELDDWNKEYEGSEEEYDDIEDDCQRCRYCEIARRIDAFVTKGGSWPMRRHHFSWRSVVIPNRWDPHSDACKESCRVDLDDIDLNWSEPVDDSSWESPIPGRTAERGTEFEELFFHDYDAQGFHKDGYNDEGIHFSNAPVTDPAAPEGAISYAKVYRETLASILSKIKRNT